MTNNVTPLRPQPKEWREKCAFCKGTGKREDYHGAFSRNFGQPQTCYWCAGRGVIIHGCEVPPEPPKAA